MVNPELKCELDSGDRIAVRRTVSSDCVTLPIAFEAFGYADDLAVKDAFVTAGEARKFARGILALADEVDGGEAESSTPAVKVGDRVRVIKDDRYNDTGEFVGLVGVVGEVDLGARLRFLVTFGPGRHGETNGSWYCEDVELVDEPAATVEPPSAAPTRLELLEAAKRLAPGGDADDWMRLATYMEGN